VIGTNRYFNLKGKVEKKYIGPSVEESRRTFFGMLNSLDVFHMDDFHKIRKSEVKQLQLKLAEQYGLKTPKTLITNNPDEVRKFYNNCKNGIISKMQASFAIYENDEENVVFTNELKESDLKNLEDLIYCPMQFQEKIDKKIELRATIIGNQVFTASINSQANEESKIDWRKQGIEMVNDWKKHDLPKEIEKKLLKMMDFYKINYGAADFIVTPQNEYYFLEINPAGEFFWLEKSNPHFPLSSAIADVLLGNVQRRI
jgi:glutathione synthase/RimK-type ligase-like ATP-grasp enzyme